MKKRVSIALQGKLGDDGFEHFQSLSLGMWSMALVLWQPPEYYLNLLHGTIMPIHYRMRFFGLM